MVNGTGTGQPVRRREIVAADLDVVAGLLCRGFPKRTRSYWIRGLRRMAERTDVPPGCPRFGMLIETATGPVGVLLMLFSSHGAGLRCNLSSWYAEPAHRMNAPLLIASVLKRRDVTFTNLSPAPHTWATIEAQGFEPYSLGRALALPLFARRREPATVRIWRGQCDMPEAALLDRHAALGCTAMTAEGRDGLRPLVVLPFRARAGRLHLPVAELVYCRDPTDLARFAAPLGRVLAGFGWFGLVVEREAVTAGLPAVPFGRARRYVRGPLRPRPGDLADSEKVLFGP